VPEKPGKHSRSFSLAGDTLWGTNIFQQDTTRRPSFQRTTHAGFFADFSFHGRVGVAAGSRLCLARSHIICSSSRLAEIAPSAELHNMGVRMTRHVIWAEDEKFTGWCCSQCLWGIVAPRLESTVAALALTARRKSALTNTPAHGTFNKRRGLGLGAQMMEYSRQSVSYRDIYGRLYIRTSI
jgi:hypothetical protein